MVQDNVITSVPWPNPGAGRDVYPGFLQLSGFMSMNLDRHANAHKDLFMHLIRGDGDSALKHRQFYDEYLAVMDLTAEFYLETIEIGLCPPCAAEGRDDMARPSRRSVSAIRQTALMTIEGEKDDITGLGQCRAAHDLCRNLPDDHKFHYECKGVGHYGIFNSSRFRTEIAPRIAQFVREFDMRANFIPDDGMPATATLHRPRCARLRSLPSKPFASGPVASVRKSSVSSGSRDPAFVEIHRLLGERLSLPSKCTAVHPRCVPASSDDRDLSVSRTASPAFAAIGSSSGK